MSPDSRGEGRAVVTNPGSFRSNPVDKAALAALSDEALVDRTNSAQAGDTRFFDELVRRYERMVRANCRYLTRAEDDSWDLAQEVLLKAYGGLQGFKQESQFRTWLWRIKANHCLNYLEHWAVRGREEVMPASSPGIRDHPASSASPLEQTETAQAAERVRAVLDSMGDKERVAVILRDLDGMTYAEISTQLGISLSAAKMRTSRARQEFRERYRDRYPSEENPS